MMKKTVSLLLAAVLLLTSFVGCSRKKNDEEQTTAPIENVTAEDPGVPFFMLANLPELGAYNGAGAYARWYPEYTDTFKPSKEYGALIMYIGDTRKYNSVGFEDELIDCNSLYGLATLDGKVVVDPVYSSIYADADDDGNAFLVMTKGENIRAAQGDYDETVTVIPQDGSWDITLKGWYFCGANNKRLVFGDGNQVKVFDYSGKLLFTFDAVDTYGYHDGYMMFYSQQPIEEAPELPTAPTVPSTVKPAVPATAAPSVPATSASPSAPTKQPVTQPSVPAPTEEPATAESTTHAPTTHAPVTNPPTTASPTVGTTVRNRSVGAMSAPQVTPMALVTSQPLSGYTVIDTDGNVVITGLTAADGFFQNGYMSASIGDKYGIISFTGQWVVPAMYKTTSVFDGKYFLLNDGKTVMIVDVALKQVAKYGADLGRTADYIGGQMVYSLYQHNDKIGRQDTIFYDMVTNKAIVNTQSGLPATGYFYETNLFYTIGKDKFCYVFGADGSTVSSYKDVIGIEMYDNIFIVTSGTETDCVDRIYAQGTNKLLFEYQSRKNGNYTTSYTTGDKQAIMQLYHYQESDNISSIDIVNISTGQYLFKNCKDAMLQYVNGRTYISVAYDSYTAVYTGQLKLLLKMTNQYTD